MTREERLDWLCRLRGQLICFNMSNRRRANFIHALSDEIKDLQQNPCEVEAAKLQQAYNKGFEDCKQSVLDMATTIQTDDFSGNEVIEVVDVDDIKALPPVTPKPKTGRWINIEDRTDWYDAAYKCSCCGREIITPYELKNNLYGDYPFCHCGAKMVESQESQESEG